jgi:glyoxylase-like metal-dependent hydrolase (beta-lactamase superfamily II)
LTSAAGVRIDNPQDRTAANGWFRFAIGGMEAVIVTDGRMRPHSIAGFFPDVSPGDLEDAKARAGITGDHFSMEQNCLILRHAGRVVLFDTGVGRGGEAGWDGSGILLDSMAAAGITPDQVTDIVLTHAHNDHVWGMAHRDGAPIFTAAQVHLSRVEFDHWTDLNRLAQGGFSAECVLGARRNLLPYADRMRFVAEGAEVLPGVVALASPGHAPGHFSYLIGSGDHRHLFLGDVAHTSHLQMAHPDWAFAYDFDSAQAIRTRLALLEQAEGLTVIGYHFDFPGIGKIRRAGAAYCFEPAD